MSTTINGRVLIIAGSDSGGGAGIQADIKTVTALGGYAMTAITALTAQNTLGVQAVHPVPRDFLDAQIRSVMDDLGTDAIKTGMLHDQDTIDGVVDLMHGAGQGIPLVVDPVMVAQSGHRLLDEQAVTYLARRLLPCAAVMTPNRPEAEVLLGHEIASRDAMCDAARELHARWGAAVLLKGGHVDGDTVCDVLTDSQGRTRAYEHQRVDTRHTHGTGCTLASAVAAGLARGLELDEAVATARAYVLEAVRTAPGFGHGDGPVNHCHPVQPPAAGG